MESIAKELGTTLLIVTAFALLFPLLLTFLLPTENIVLNFVILIAPALLFPTIAGLITKDETIPFFVSTVSWLVFFTSLNFPYQYYLWHGWIATLGFGVIMGFAFGFLSSVASTSLLTLKLSRGMITRKRIVVSVLFILALAVSYGVYSHLEEVISYLDEHTWFATMISTIATFILTVFGKRFYEQRKKKK